MPADSDFVNLIAIWPVIGVLFVASAWRKGAVGAGLVLAYAMGLAQLHFFASMLYLDPYYAFNDPSVVADGHRQSTYGLLAFAAGSLIVGPLIMWLFRSPPTEDGPPPRINTRHARFYLVAGVVSYFILLPIAGKVPTVTALVAAGWNLTVVGLALLCWQAFMDRKWTVFVGWLLATLGLPVATMVSKGFVSYGTAAAIAASAFLFSYYRPRWQLVLGGLLVGFLAASGYVTYMRDRSALRDTLKTGTLADRVQVVVNMVTNIELFDPRNPDHILRVDERLNQDALVGMAVQNLGIGGVEYAYGTTVEDSFIGLIPRAVWPDKPAVGGSIDLVSNYAGIDISEGTSVGVGHVMEFYINFGTAGVVLGLLVLGIAVSVVDRGAGERLRRGDYRGFAMWLMPGLGLIQVYGSLSELTTTTAAGLVLIYLVNRRLRDRPAQTEEQAPVVKLAGTRTWQPTPPGLPDRRGSSAS